MSLPQLHENLFQCKLEKTVQSLKGKDLRNYWLNRDGTFVSKNWAGRVVRWILNLFFDKTINDTWALFTQALKQYEYSTKLFQGPSPEANAFIAGRCERLRFIVQFLLSRKSQFDRSIKKNPERSLLLKKTIKDLRSHPHTTIKTLGEGADLQPIQKNPHASIKGVSKLKESLQFLFFPSVNYSSMTKRAPSVVFAVSPQTHKDIFDELEIADLVTFYDQLILDEQGCIQLSALLSDLESPKANEVLLNLLKNNYKDDVQITGTPLIAEAVKKARQGLPKKNEQLKSSHVACIFRHVKNGLSECFEPKGKNKGMGGTDSDLQDRVLTDFILALGQQTKSSPHGYKLLAEIYTGKSNLVYLIDKVKLRDKKVFGINESIYQQYYDQIELFLKNILFAITNDVNIPQEKKLNAVKEIAIAGGECGPRWIEETKKQYRLMTLYHVTELESKVLEHIQSLKEDLFLELFQNLSKQVEYHILDSFRKEYGKELGFDDSTVNLDVFAYKINQKGLKSLKRVFLNEYNGYRLIKGIKDRINLHGYEPSYFSYLAKRVSARLPKVSDPTAYVMENFMGEDYKTITDEGVLFLLQEMKILKR